MRLYELMGLAAIGPVAIRHGNPSFSWQSKGHVRPCTIGGLCSWVQAKQLSELVDNANRRVTVRDHTGVLEYIAFDDDLLRDFRGWYLLEEFSLAADRKWSVNGNEGDVAFNLGCVHLGSRQVVVTSTSRSLVNDFTVAAEAIVVDPMWLEDPTGTLGGLVVSTGGRIILREYDALTPTELP